MTTINDPCFKYSFFYKCCIVNRQVFKCLNNCVVCDNMVSKMPKIETLRRHFPDCRLSDDKMMEIAEWLRVHLKQQHITPNNKMLKVLMEWGAR